MDERGVGDLVGCIRLDRDCADLCRLLAAFLARGSSFSPALLEACIAACDACADECERHAYEHCRACAEACRACADECRWMTSKPPLSRAVATSF
jgi:hypothetical protein